VRPTALESLRALQGALAETLAPELQTLFAQDAAQTLAMLTESLAAEWDRAAEDLRADNAAMRAVLERAPSGLAALPERNENRDALVSEIDGVMREAGAGDITISSLSAEHQRLAAVLERLLCLAEDTAGESDALADTRREAYAHLRTVAVRGWSFWDVASFRERMMRARPETLA
jgi:hypothetical protein